MATELHHYSDTWHGGFPLVPPLKHRSGDSSLSRAFRTGSPLGSLRAETAGALWHFEPGLPPGFDVDTVHLLNAGYRLASRRGSDLILLQLHPGLWIGDFPESAVPELFCPSRAVLDEESRSWLDLGPQHVLLEHQVLDGRRRIALAVGPDPDTLRQSTRQLLETPSAREDWNRLWKQRMNWLTRLGAEERPVMFDLALETLDASLEPATGSFQDVWPRDPVDGALHLNQLPGIFPALARMEADATLGLLHTLAALPELPSGAFPATLAPADAPDNTPAWPVIARALSLAHRAGTLPDLPPAILPRLRKHIDSYLTAPRPAWPDPDASLTPEVADPDIRLMDLPALLVAEIEAFEVLSGDLDTYAQAKEQLKQQVLTETWSSARNVFLDQLAAGGPVKRMTVGGLIPLLWKDLPDDKQRGLHRSLESGDSLLGSGGLRQWEPRAGDPSPPPLRPEIQHLFLHALLKDAPRDLSARLGSAWASTLDRFVTAAQGLPLDWSDSAPAGWHPLTAAFCLRFAPLQTKVDLELSRYPRFIRFLEHNRRLIVGIAAAITILLPSTVGLHYATRDDFGQRRELEEAGHAETLTHLRRFAEAEEVYNALLARSRPSDRHIDYLNRRARLRIHLNKFPEARKDLEAVILRDEDLLRPNAHWNLAQLLWRMGEIDAARTLLEDIREIFSEGYPDLGNRATTALSLLDQGHRIP